MKKTPENTKKEIEKLVSDLNGHCYRYHVIDSPLISDEEYDRLYRELKQMEKSTGYILADSPTQRIGSPPMEKYEKVKHAEPMLSLGNAFSYDEVVEFDRKVKRFLKTDEHIEYTVEPKYDGLAVELIYENGILHKAATRGDGNVGEDVTLNMKTVKGVPLRIEGEDVPEKIDIRGEIYMDIKEFEELNREREREGEPPFANPRNAAAGSVRQLNSSITANRKLHLACYGAGAVKGKKFKSHWEFMEWLKKSRFPVPQNIILSERIEGVLESIREIEATRNSFAFETDGAVIKVNAINLQDELGVKTREPRWAIAYKFAAHRGITRILDIRSSVGRLGTITPVASLEPVRIGGVTVSSSTLHNWDEIERMEIGIGDTVEVERAGDVIPHVVAVKQRGGAGKFPPPAECPECGSSVERDEGGVAYRCIGINCAAQVQERIKHYASRSAMEIEGLGEKNIKLLYAHGLVKHFIDIYALKKEDLMNLPRFAEKSAQNLIDAIEKSKATTLARFIYSLGIIYVGEYASKLLAKNFKDINALYNIEAERIVSIKHMGEKTAESVSKFFNESQNINVLTKLEILGFKILNPDFEAEITGERRLSGLTFVITGTLSMPRKDLEELIEKNGGHVSKSVSNKTSYLVLGDSPGSKFNKAESLGISMLSCDDLLKMIQGE